MKIYFLFTILDDYYVIGRVSIRTNKIQIKINYHPIYKNITSYIHILQKTNGLDKRIDGQPKIITATPPQNVLVPFMLYYYCNILM